MTLTEKGLSHQLRLECWANGSIPRDCRDLAKVLGINEGDLTQNLTENVLFEFQEREGELFCPELEQQRENLRIRRERQKQGGAEGGKNTQKKRREVEIDVERRNQGKLQGKVKTDLKLLRRNEKNRDETSKEELINETKDEHGDWHASYDAAPLAGPLDYKSQSSGY